MTLNEFINELKHKTTNIIITCNGFSAIFDADVSRYQYWLDKSKYGNKNIICIYPLASHFGFCIHIKYKEGEVQND